jgi:ArsR family transcriptional regulator
MKILKALGDDTRLKILSRISRGEVCACELPRMVGISQPAVSQHLKVLLAVKLVEVREEGARRIYSLSPKGKRVLSDISRW